MSFSGFSGMLRVRFASLARFTTVRALQPDLSPVGIDRARTKHPTRAVPPAAKHSVQHDGGILHVEQLPGPLVEDPFDTARDAICPAAIRHRFGVEVQATVAALCVQCGENLRVRLDLHHLAWLEIQLARGRRASNGNRSTAPRK